MEPKGVGLSVLMLRAGLSPSIDLFATRINTQLPIFVSYRPDPETALQSMHFFGLGKNGLLRIPPTWMSDEVLQKIYHCSAKMILIALNYPSQPFYPTLKELSVMNFIMPPRKTILYLTNKLLLHQRQITPQIVNTTGMISR